MYLIIKWLHHGEMKHTKSIPEILTANIKSRQTEHNKTQNQLV